MSIIDYTYFTGLLDLPNLDYNGYSEINSVITKYEKKIMTDALGYELYTLLLADLDGSGNPTSDRFIDIMDGAEFELPFNGQTYKLKWEGLRNDSKESFIANYVFYNYVASGNVKISDVGAVSLRAKGGDRVSPIVKLEEVWNDMLNMYGRVPPMYYAQLRNVVQGSLLSVAVNNLPSLVNFMLVNKATYPEWTWKMHESINRFGI